MQKDNSYVEELKLQDKKAKKDKFVILSSILAATLITSGAIYGIMKDPSEWTDWTKTVTSATQTQKVDALKSVETQKVTTQSFYLQNRSAIVELDKLDDVAKALKLSPLQFVTENETQYKKAIKALDDDKMMLDSLYKIKDDKESDKIKKKFFTEDNIKTFSAYQNGSIKRFDKLEDLHTKIVNKKDELAKIKEDVMTQVRKNISTFNVDGAEKNLLSSANDEVGNNKSQIQNAKNSGDLEEGDYNDLMKSTNEAYSAMEKSIGEDKQKVAELVKTANTTTTASAPHFSFFDYWLISQWMGSSGSYNSGYQAGVAAARPTNTYSSLYSASNPSTKAAQSWATTQKATGANYNSLSQKIAQTRSASMARISQARAASAKASAARSASVSRGGFGGSSVSSGGG